MQHASFYGNIMLRRLDPDLRGIEERNTLLHALKHIYKAREHASPDRSGDNERSDETLRHDVHGATGSNPDNSTTSR